MRSRVAVPSSRRCPRHRWLAGRRRGVSALRRQSGDGAARRPRAAPAGRASRPAARSASPPSPAPSAIRRSPAPGPTSCSTSRSTTGWWRSGDNNQLLPGLATAWDSPDGKVWTFTLRSGVTFSNGQPFTADDVVYTFDRLRDPERGLAPGRDLYANVTGIKAVDPTHVEFTLKDANPEFPSDVSRLPRRHPLQVGRRPGDRMGGHRPLHASSRTRPRTGPSSRRTRATG